MPKQLVHFDTTTQTVVRESYLFLVDNRGRPFAPYPPSIDEWPRHTTDPTLYALRCDFLAGPHAYSNRVAIAQ